MADFNIPAGVNFILDSISDSGYEAYLVGGCVRDYFLGKEPYDFDITTNAAPEKIIEIFEDKAYTVGTGIKHGTVTVIKDDISAEVTTYRIDGDYSDNRHPEAVKFSDRLEDDVLRRDFTVNSIAYSPKYGFRDYVGGVEDIKRGIIRCVGNPQIRFEEDALRILRALRFSSVLGFEIDGPTAEAIFEKAHLLGNISKERISLEFVKILCGKNAEKILMEYRDVLAVVLPDIRPMFDFEQHTPYHKYDVYTHSVKAVSSLDVEDKIVRVAAFFHDIGKPECFFTDENGVGHFYGHAQKSTEISDRVLKDLRFDNNFRTTVTELIKHHDAPIENEEKRIKRLLRNLGEEQFFRLLKLQRADNAAQSEIVRDRILRFDSVEATAEKLLSEKTCFSLSDLCINGNDLIQMGIPQGRRIGFILNQLLDEVIENKTENNRVELLRRAAEYKGGQ